MAKVSNLAIKVQTGSDTHYASWTFNTSTTSTTSSTLKKGDLVSIKSGATYYNGVDVPSWVESDQWYLIQVDGDRAVLGKNKSGSHNIVSPINTKFLTGGSSGSSSTVSKNTLDHYEVKWDYATGDGIWFTGSSSSVEVTNATYSAPDNATKIRVRVKPVSKTYTVNNKETSYWTGEWVSATYETSYDPPEKPAVPTVEIEKYKLTASLENISDPRSDQIQFQVLNGTKVVNTGTSTVKTCQASFTCTITAGGEYRVRCRAINKVGTTTSYSEWSDYTSTSTTIPATPKGITTIRAASETSVYLAWEKVSTAETYEIEYATEKRYFDGSDSTTSKTGITTTQYEITGLQSGDEYFFRLRATNKEGSSAWSGIKSVVIGKDPSAPTTWSSTTTAITGENLTLYWIHNSEDGSSQTYADLEIYVDGVKETHTIQNSTDEDEKDKTSSYVVDTSEYIEGTKLEWRVRTAGITKAYGDWSIQRTVDIYAPPTFQLTMTDKSGASIETLNTFPFYISGLAGPSTQIPIGYYLEVTAEEAYETVDNVGNRKFVNIGDQVYSNYFDITDSLLVELSANNIDLHDGISYKVSGRTTMNSGLTADATLTFDVSWTDISYEPDAGVVVDSDTFVAYITPFCRDDEGVTVDDVSLSVYRREFDGTFTELATDISSTSNTVVTDPHPALDYARYRIIAITLSTGAVGYYDVPGYPVKCTSVVIQWDEDWTNFDTTNEDEMVQPPWGGSMLVLPYNIDVDDKHDPDVSLIKYIGRSHPVTYYGTQEGKSASWKMAVPKSDKDILYGLRRLSRWMGDVYVREPSGSGYWANVKVSFSQKHRDLKLPITLDITRVEGGI